MDAGVLILNAGSSSLKFAVFKVGEDAPAFEVAARGQVSGIGSHPAFTATVAAAGREVASEHLRAIHSHQQAIAHALNWVGEHVKTLRLIGIGHRVVHGGPTRRRPALITPGLLQELEGLCPLAPHHQPHNLAAIRAVAATAIAMHTTALVGQTAAPAGDSG